MWTVARATVRSPERACTGPAAVSADQLRDCLQRPFSERDSHDVLFSFVVVNLVNLVCVVLLVHVVDVGRVRLDFDARHRRRLSTPFALFDELNRHVARAFGRNEAVKAKEGEKGMERVVSFSFLR